jgi:hypothetical protein
MIFLEGVESHLALPSGLGVARPRSESRLLVRQPCALCYRMPTVRLLACRIALPQTAVGVVWVSFVDWPSGPAVPCRRVPCSRFLRLRSKRRPSRPGLDHHRSLSPWRASPQEM